MRVVVFALLPPIVAQGGLLFKDNFERYEDFGLPCAWSKPAGITAEGCAVRRIGGRKALRITGNRVPVILKEVHSYLWDVYVVRLRLYLERGPVAVKFRYRSETENYTLRFRKKVLRIDQVPYTRSERWVPSAQKRIKPVERRWYRVRISVAGGRVKASGADEVTGEKGFVAYLDPTPIPTGTLCLPTNGGSLYADEVEVSSRPVWQMALNAKSGGKYIDVRADCEMRRIPFIRAGESYTATIAVRRTQDGLGSRN